MNILIITTLLFVLLIAAVSDKRDQKIPNALTLPCFLVVPAYHTWVSGWEGFLFSAGGIGLGVGLLVLPYLMGGMGAGDAKLMGAVGGFIGAKGVLYAFFFTAIAGGLYALLLILLYRLQFQGFFKEKKEDLLSFFLTKKFSIGGPTEATIQRPRLCYGLAIAVGTFTYIVLNVTGFVAFGQ